MVIFEQILIATRDFTDQKVFFYYAHSLGRSSWCYQEMSTSTIKKDYPER
jgi:hypothetical protein